jgi:hypothetical protein
MATQAIIPQPTGNPILDNPTLKAAFMASQGGAQQPPQPQGATMPPAGQQPPPQISLPEKPMPSPTPSKQPVVFGPFGQKSGPVAQRGTQEGDEQERDRLLSTGSGLSQIHSRIESAMPNHPVLGKVLGIGAQGLATLGDIGLRTVSPMAESMIPGTAGYHAAQLGHVNQALTQDIGNAGKEAETQAQQSEVPLHAAQTERAQQQTAAGVQVPPPDALVKDHPEIQGMMETPATWALMEKTFSGNQTRENTTNATVAGREQVAQTGAEAKKTAAQIAADERKSAEDAQDRTREAVARIRVASTGGGKGGANGVTNNSRARGEMSDTILQMAPTMLQEIDKLSEKIGPGAGRWNNFWVKKGGMNDPDYAALDQDLGLYASALAVAHFGARGGGQHFIEGLKKDLSQAQSPEDLKARILHADKWLEGYQREGRGEGGNQPAQGGAPQRPASVPPDYNWNPQGNGGNGSWQPPKQ